MIKIFSNINELNVFAADRIVAAAADSMAARGFFTLVLAGGSTPKSLYQLLAGESYQNKIDWSKTFFFFGDERDVPPDADESNFKMANENLFQPLKIVDKNIYRWQTELPDARLAAENYEEILSKFFADERPRFDLMLLGMGDDGHTASLFPRSEALFETRRNAVANRVEKLDTTRLTLTFPAINNARTVIFLVKGSDKAETLRTVLEGSSKPEKYPAQSVKPANGELFWLIDREAAALLRR